MRVSNIAFHMGWPGPQDPWYQANTTDYNARRNYYGINAIPALSVDGDTFIYRSNSTRIRAALISRLQIQSPLWMQMANWSNAAGDTVFVQLKVVSEQPIASGHTLHMAVAGIHEHWNSPSPNGMTDFYSTMYKMYPSGTGQAFTHSGNTADTSIYVAAFQVRTTPPVPMNIANLKFVCWVQNNTNRVVVQSAQRSFTAITGPSIGDTLYVGVPAQIRWRPDVFYDNVAVELNRNFPDGTWESIIVDTPNDGAAIWMTSAPATGNARIRIYQVNYPANADTSKGDFVIAEPSAIAVSPDPLTATVASGDTLTGIVTVTNNSHIEAVVRLRSDTGTSDYLEIHSTDPEGPEYEWVDVSTGTVGPSGDDANSSAFNLPFPFTYYGRSYNRIWLSTNGWLTFSNPGSNYYYNNSPLPLSGPNTFIAVFWNDLNVTGAGASTRFLSDPDNDRFVLAWVNVQRYGDSGTRINAQAVFYRDGRLIFQYATLSGTTDEATVGIQNHDGSLFTQVWHNSAVPSNYAVAFDEQRIWARPVLNTFVVPANGSYELPIVWDARSFARDTTVAGVWYFGGNILPVEVPVTMTVGVNAVREHLVPTQFAVSEAYPNPFNPATSIELELAQAMPVRLAVYDVLGREVATLLDSPLGVGHHRLIINGSDWASGLYFLKVTAGSDEALRKLLLIK